VPLENVIVMIILLWGMWTIRRYFEGAKKEAHQEVKAAIAQMYDQLQGDAKDYTFYCSGNAVVWIESSREDFETALLRSCRVYQPGFLFFFYLKPEFTFNVNEDRREIIYVLGKSEFDFRSKKIYLGDGKCRDIHA
jgi:hypothetical protein